MVLPFWIWLIPSFHQYHSNSPKCRTYLKWDQSLLAFIELQGNNGSNSNTLEDEESGIWLFTFPFCHVVLVPQPSPQHGKLTEGRIQKHSVLHCCLLQNAYSLKHSSSAQEGIFKNKCPCSCVPLFLHSFTGWAGGRWSGHIVHLCIQHKWHPSSPSISCFVMWNIIRPFICLPSDS